MTRAKSNSIIGDVIDFIFGSADPEEEAKLEKSAAMVYEIMDFVARHKNSGNRRYERDFFCSSLKKELFSCDEAIQFGIGQGWIEQVEDKIEITEYAFAYEKDFWKSFR